MTQGEPFIAQSVILALIWLAGYLRIPGAFASFQRRTAAFEPEKPVAAEV